MLIPPAHRVNPKNGCRVFLRDGGHAWRGLDPSVATIPASGGGCERVSKSTGRWRSAARAAAIHRVQPVTSKRQMQRLRSCIITLIAVHLESTNALEEQDRGKEERRRPLPWRAAYDAPVGRWPH